MDVGEYLTERRNDYKGFLDSASVSKWMPVLSDVEININAGSC